MRHLLKRFAVRTLLSGAFVSSMMLAAIVLSAGRAEAQQCPFGGGCSPIWSIKITLNESLDNGTTFTTSTYDGGILIAYPMGSNSITLSNARFDFSTTTGGTSQTVAFSKSITGTTPATSCTFIVPATSAPVTYTNGVMATSGSLSYTTANACSYQMNLTYTASANLGPQNYQVDFVTPIDQNFIIYHNDQVIGSSGNLTAVFGPGDGIVTPPGITVLGVRNSCGVGQRMAANTYLTFGAPVTGGTCVSDQVVLRRGSSTYFRFVSTTGSDASADGNDGQVATGDGTVTPNGASSNLTVTVQAASAGANSSTLVALLAGAAALKSRTTGDITQLSAGGQTSGSVSSPTPTLYGSVLPVSRSVQVGATATAFATILNAGNDIARGCKLIPPATFVGNFSFQTTSSTTNALTGTPNTAVDVPVGGVQSFVFAMTPTAAAAATDILLTFACGTAAPVLTIPGVNTLLLSGSTTPVADNIAIGLTPSNDGFARAAVGDTGLFVIASANIGTTAALTARARLSNTGLPATVTVCQTNPSTGVCLSPAAASVTATVANNQNTTWAAFIQPTATIAADPAINRVFFEFFDPSGAVRGSTSTAVTTAK